MQEVEGGQTNQWPMLKYILGGFTLNLIVVSSWQSIYLSRAFYPHFWPFPLEFLTMLTQIPEIVMRGYWVVNKYPSDLYEHCYDFYSQLNYYNLALKFLNMLVLMMNLNTKLIFSRSLKWSKNGDDQPSQLIFKSLAFTRYGQVMLRSTFQGIHTL